MNTDQRPELTSQSHSCEEDMEKGIGPWAECLNTKWNKCHERILKIAFEDDIEAVRVVQIVGHVARLIDNLKDESNLDFEHISETVEEILFELPTNRFYQKHCEKITTFLVVAMSAWNHSNETEERVRSEGHSFIDKKLLVHSYVWRNTINELVGMLIFLKKMDQMTEDGTPASICIDSAKMVSSGLMKEFREFYLRGTESLDEYECEQRTKYD